jgi:enamine deaminase RidA (YjgF/YER057c/UK114 family)
MPVELIRSGALSDQVPYAYAAVVSSGSLVFTAGACPLDEEGVVTPLDDVAGQAALVMRNLEQALAAAGATLADVAKSTVYVATSERDDLVTAWQVIREAFGEHDAPSTLVAVPVLGYEGQLVEVEAVAAVARS